MASTMLIPVSCLLLHRFLTSSPICDGILLLETYTFSFQSGIIPWLELSL